MFKLTSQLTVRAVAIVAAASTSVDATVSHSDSESGGRGSETGIGDGGDGHAVEAAAKNATVVASRGLSVGCSDGGNS